MANTEKEQQILNMVTQSSSVLICLPHNPSTDAIASGLGLLAVIEKMGKHGKIISSEFQLPANHAFLLHAFTPEFTPEFLPKSNEIFDDFAALHTFIASVDLIIVVDCQNLNALGRVYEMNTDFFSHTPLITIDHSPANDHYGQVNLVNVTATSTSEMIFELVKDWDEEIDENIIDEYIATNLLAGIISKTKSFQSGTITPRSLAIAAHLISQGARREDIVKNLYQSKQISTLKLWGRALSKLEADHEHHIVWSTLTQKDFEDTATSESELPDVIDELIINTPEAKNVFMLYEGAATDGNTPVHALISTAPSINVEELFQDFSPEGTTHCISFITNSTVPKLQQIIHQRLSTA